MYLPLWKVYSHAHVENPVCSWPLNSTLAFRLVYDDLSCTWIYFCKQPMKMGEETL